MKKPEKTESTVNGERVGMPDDEFAASFPTLSEYLCTIAWEDGSKRATSTVVLFVEEGSLKLALNDRANDRSLYVASDSLRGALIALEEALASGQEGRWKSWKRGRKN